MYGGKLMLFAATSTWYATWITPMWLLGLGVAIGLAVLAIVFGILKLAAPGWATEMAVMVKEGWLLPIFYVSLVLTVLTAVATPIVPYHTLLTAASRMFSVGTFSETVEVPAATKDFPIPLPFSPTELQSFTLESDQPISVLTKVSKGVGPDGLKRLEPNDPFSWHRTAPLDKPFAADVQKWTATNVGTAPANLSIGWRSDIEFPEVRLIAKTALAFVGLFLFYAALRLLFPTISAIAQATAKGCVAQPIFYVSLVIGSVGLIVFLIVPYHTFGEDVKMLKDSALTWIMFWTMVVAVWSASVSISDEIEGRTAMTVLSKPVSRRQFILGKFLGVMGPVALMFVLLGLLFTLTIPYKVVYDAREVAKTLPTWQTCCMEMTQTLPGLVLTFYETVVLASISVALSTRLPMVANLITCASIYVLGHMVPVLVNSSVGKFEIVRFVGQFIALLLPVLDHFNIQPAIAAGVEVPLDYLAWALAYCVLYSTIAMLFALILFEDRDLA